MFEIEKIRREELEILQLERLKKIVTWAYEKSAFYQKSFQNHGVTPDNIQSLADVSKLPFVTSEDIRGNELEFLTLPLSSVVRISRCGEFTNFYTKDDIRNNVEMIIRALVSSNIFRGSTVEISGNLSDSRNLDILYALESIGATVVLRGENFSVDKIIGVTEELSNSFNTTSKIFNLYALPEIGNAGLLCPCGAGYHVQEDNFLVETLNDELVITTLTAQARPLIRYRTRQKVKIINEPCKCGRTFKRIV